MKPDINSKLISEKIQNSTVVVTFVNNSYLKIFEIFASCWKRVNANNLLVVCLDQQTLARVTELGLEGILAQYDIKSIHYFWEFRMAILNNIFKSTRKNIVHTDGDCFWFSDIVNDIERDVSGDVYYSVGKTYPQEIAKKYGFVLCCGFFMIKYKKTTETYFDKVMINDNRDDQVMTNEYIFNNAKEITTGMHVDGMFTNQIILNDGLVVKGISTEIITRWEKKITTAKAFHPYLDGTVTEKLEQLKRYTRLHQTLF